MINHDKSMDTPHWVIPTKYMRIHRLSAACDCPISLGGGAGHIPTDARAGLGDSNHSHFNYLRCLRQLRRRRHLRLFYCHLEFGKITHGSWISHNGSKPYNHPNISWKSCKNPIVSSHFGKKTFINVVSCDKTNACIYLQWLIARQRFIGKHLSSTSYIFTSSSAWFCFCSRSTCTLALWSSCSNFFSLKLTRLPPS